MRPTELCRWKSYFYHQLYIVDSDGPAYITFKNRTYYYNPIDRTIHVIGNGLSKPLQIIKKDIQKEAKTKYNTCGTCVHSYLRKLTKKCPKLFEASK